MSDDRKNNENGDEEVSESGEIALKVQSGSVSSKKQEKDQNKKSTKRDAKNDDDEEEFDDDVFFPLYHRHNIPDKHHHQQYTTNNNNQDETLSEEDKKLKEDLELAVERVSDPEIGVSRLAITTLRSKIKSATSSMTSVPKPLKFLGPHYETLKKAFSQRKNEELADVLSVLAMTMAPEGKRESLSFKLEGCKTDVAAWGHEYVRNLSGEIAEEYRERTTRAEEQQEEDSKTDEKDNVSDLIDLAKRIVKFDMEHNAEAEAVDLLMEVQQLPLLLPLEFDERNTDRVCAYLLRSALYEVDPEERTGVFNVAFDLYSKQGRICDALRVAIRMKDATKIEGLFEKTVDDVATRTQLAYIMGANRSFGFQLDDEEVEDASDINSIIGNYSVLCENYRRLATALDVVDAKTPEQVYKSRLGDTGSTGQSADGAHVESAAQNAASTFVNAFVNVGFGEDKLICKTDEEGRNLWLYKNKAKGMMSAAASMGMVHQWDIDDGFSALDKFLYVDDVNIKAGGILGIGVCNSGVYNTDIDAAIGVLPEHLERDSAYKRDENTLLNCSAILALGLSYAGSARDDVMELLIDFASEDVEDDASEQENDPRVHIAALALGMIFVGTGEDECAQPMIERLLQCSEDELSKPENRLYALGLSLIYLGCEEGADVAQDILSTLPHKTFRDFALLTLKACAYTGSGNVLKVQEMLHACAEHIQEQDKSYHQAAAVLGIAMITMGEEVGGNMAMRTMEHLLQYGEIPIRRVVPLAIALLYVSDPEYSVTDLLSKLTHDQDEQVAMNAILALGMIGAGTNNARIAGLLRQLSSFYKSKSDPLYVVRIAQGLLHMGKGLITLSPFHSDNLLMSNTRLSGVLITLFSAFDLKHNILGSTHYLLYALAPSVSPRMLVTLDEDGEMLPVSVRVGQAVDTVGQAGQPRRITGFQTHTTPVLLAAGERAELVDTDQYEAVPTVLEGLVVLRKKADAEESSKMDEDE